MIVKFSGDSKMNIKFFVIGYSNIMCNTCTTHYIRWRFKYSIFIEYLNLPKTWLYNLGVNTPTVEIPYPQHLLKYNIFLL